MGVRQVVVAACLAGAVCAAGIGCSGSDGATSGTVIAVDAVLDWVVGFATDVGRFVSRAAGTLADALAAAWNVFFDDGIVGNVKVDDADPLGGIYQGVLACRVDWGQSPTGTERKNHIEMKLDHPRMQRESATTTDWKLHAKEQARIQTAVDTFVAN